MSIFEKTTEIINNYWLKNGFRPDSICIDEDDYFTLMDEVGDYFFAYCNTNLTTRDVYFKGVKLERFEVLT